MKHLRVIVWMCVASMALCACKHKGGPAYMTLVNNSDIKIAFQESYYKDKDLPSDSMLSCSGAATCLEADSLFKLAYWGWDRGYKNAGWYDYFAVYKYFQFLIMDCDTFWKYHYEPCDTIYKYVPVLHVYRLTLEDLEQMNWTVVYPPKEENP